MIDLKHNHQLKFSQSNPILLSKKTLSIVVIQRF